MPIKVPVTVRNAIKNNEVQKQAFISCVEGVRQNSLANIIFYKNYTESALNNDREVERKIAHVSADIPAYWYSLHNYGMSTALLIMISDISDKGYLESLEKDLIDKYNQYSEFFKKCREEMDKYIDKANPDNVPFLFINAGFNKNNAFALGVNPFEKKKKEMEQYKDNVEAYEEAGGIKDIAEEIGKYNKLINNPVDMVYMSGNYYIKDE